MMEHLKDFNTAEFSDELHLIPGGTYVKARLDLDESTNKEDPYVFKSPTSGVLYLKAVFHILKGEYANRKVIQIIGLKGSEGDEKNTWGDAGRAFIRSLLESARHIHPKDMLEDAQRKRRIEDFSDLKGLVVAAQIGIKRDPKGLYPPQNKIQRILTKLHPKYGELLGLMPEEMKAMGVAPPQPHLQRGQGQKATDVKSFKQIGDALPDWAQGQEA